MIDFSSLGRQTKIKQKYKYKNRILDVEPAGLVDGYELNLAYVLGVERGARVAEHGGVRVASNRALVLALVEEEERRARILGHGLVEYGTRVLFFDENVWLGDAEQRRRYRRIPQQSHVGKRRTHVATLAGEVDGAQRDTAIARLEAEQLYEAQHVGRYEAEANLEKSIAK